MALCKLVRPLAIAAVAGLLCFMIALYSRPSIERPSSPFVDIHHPNYLLEEVDEPPVRLRRVDGDNYAPDNPDSDRINATLLSLVRNSELEGLIQSMRELERTFNSKFNYPWTFFNDEPFTAEFKEAVIQETNATVNFELIPPEHWAVPPWINQALYEESTRLLADQGVHYAQSLSYHQMCRWNSGFFHQHPALQHTQYYWRVEPNVHFYCDIDYDVFRFMQDHNKTYGFTINLYDEPATISTLWPVTQHFLAEPENQKFLHPNNARSWLEDASHRPLHTRKANGYSTCHFWSNFEIASLDFWRSPAYMAYFEHLDLAGGFFYERWGDAPVHSVALGLFEDRERIHWFRDIGYNHHPYYNCPNRRPGTCSGCEVGTFKLGKEKLLLENCQQSWLQHAGFGVWDDQQRDL